MVDMSFNGYGQDKKHLDMAYSRQKLWLCAASLNIIKISNTFLLLKVTNSSVHLVFA